MIHRTLVVGPLQCNCKILGCERTKEAVIVDPGDEAAKIIEDVEKAGLLVKYILHTHAHFDHIGATTEVAQHFKAPPCLHPEDIPLYNKLPVQGQYFGQTFETPIAIQKEFSDEEEIVFGDYSLRVIHTPGHSPGSVCFEALGNQGIVFSGDTLFKESVGRTDLWGGSSEALTRSIKTRLFTLEDEVRVFPGHGPSTKIGLEKRLNPFLN